MNELHPGLKRLLKWAREASPSQPPEAPFGFSGRVLGSRQEVRAATLLRDLQRSAWALTCGSLVLIVGGGILIASQGSAPEPAAELSSTLTFLANNLAP